MQGTPLRPTYMPMPTTRMDSGARTQHHHASGQLNLTFRHPHESLPHLEHRAQLKTDSIFLNAQTQRAKRFISLAQKQGKEFVLPDFTVKSDGFLAKLTHRGKPQPAKVKDIKPGQILIHTRTGKAIEVKQALTNRFSEQQKRTNVQGKIVKAPNGQLRLKPTQVRTGYIFQFKGVVLNAKSQGHS